MPEDVHSLIQDTLTYLKTSIQPKQVMFVSEEERAFFLSKQASTTHRQEIAALPEIAPRKPISDIPKVQKACVSDASVPLHSPKNPTAILPDRKADTDLPRPASPILKERDSSHPSESLSPIKKTLQRIAPQLKIIDEVPDDAEAKRVASAWKEKIPDIEVVLLACDIQADTLELLKGLAKAIDQNLAKSKVITAERLEREKRWDLFLTQNQLRLVIASDGIKKFPELMRYYKALPTNAQFFLEQTPLLSLSPTSVYKSLEHKALLWKTLCQMLKK